MFYLDDQIVFIIRVVKAIINLFKPKNMKKESLIRVKVPVAVDENNEPLKVKSIESFHVVITRYENNQMNMYRENKGMDSFALLGLLTMIRDEISSRFIDKPFNDEFKEIKRVVRKPETIEIIELKK